MFKKIFFFAKNKFFTVLLHLILQPICATCLLILTKNPTNPLHTTNFESFSDCDLLKLFQEEKNNDAINTLWQRYAHLLFGQALNYLKDIDAANDAVQHAALQLLTTKNNVEKPQHWLATIVRNFCLANMKYAVNKDVIDEENDDINKKEYLFVQNEVLNTLIIEEENTALMLAMNELSKEQHICLKLFYWEKHSFKEIAELTGYDVNMVKSYLQNGKLNLRKKLKN